MKVSPLNLLNSIIFELWNVDVETHVFTFSPPHDKIFPHRKMAKLNELYYNSHKNFKSNIRFSQYHYGSLDSQRIKFSALQVARSLTSLYIDFINIFRSNCCRTATTHDYSKRKGENGKTKSIKCYSCFTLTTSKKFIVADEMAKGKREKGKKLEMGIEQHQFVATSDLLADL